MKLQITTMIAVLASCMLLSSGANAYDDGYEAYESFYSNYTNDTPVTPEDGVDGSTVDKDNSTAKKNSCSADHRADIKACDYVIIKNPRGGYRKIKDPQCVAEADHKKCICFADGDKNKEKRCGKKPGGDKEELDTIEEAF